MPRFQYEKIISHGFRTILTKMMSKHVGKIRRITYWQEDVTSNDERKRDDQSPIPAGNLPIEGNQVGSENDHHSDAREADDERQPEALPNARHCVEKMRNLFALADNECSIPSIQKVDRSTSFTVDPQVL